MNPERVGVQRRPFGLPAHLVAFALVLLLPALGLGATAAWQAVRDYRTVFEERLQDTARALALALDAEIGARQATVAALATSTRLDEPAPDLAAFETLARRIAASLGTNLVLIEATTMQQVVNTALPPGTPADGVMASGFRAAAEKRKPLVSDVMIGVVSRRPVAAVSVPVERGGRVPFLLTARIEPERLADLLAAQGLRPGEFATLEDGAGVVVARSRDHANYVGRPAPDWFTAAVSGKDSGIVVGPSTSGTSTVFGFQRLRAAPNWTVKFGAPAAAYSESWQAPLRRLALGGGVALLLGIALALLLAGRITRPVAALARRAQAVAANVTPEAAPTVAVMPSGVREIEMLRTSVDDAQRALEERAAAERHARAALQESERQLRLVVAELNHRAKNALATVQALAEQTARGPAGADTAEFVAAFTARLQAFSRAHDLLTTFSWEGAALCGVVRAALAPLLEVTDDGRAPRVVLRCPYNMPLPLLAPGQAQALAMALHELATNAMKHGALSVPKGSVEIDCQAGPDGAAAVEWRERGGLPLAGAPAWRGFGMRLLQRALARSLGPGARVVVDFAPDGLRASVAFVPGLAAAVA